MKVIILAAGPEEIHGIDHNTPKCLIRLGEEYLLEKQIRIFKECDINDIRVVVGGKGKCWNEENYQKIRYLCKDVVVNNENLTTKNSFSLSLGLKGIDNGPIIAVDGDLLFNKTTILSLLNSNFKTGIISKKVTSLSEAGTKVIVEGNRVIDIGSNAKPKEFPWYAFSGIYKIGNDTFDIIKKLASLKKYKKQFITEILKDIAQDYVIINFDPSDEDNFSLRGGSFAKTKNIVMVRKEAISGKEKLKDEIWWLQNLPAPLKPHFTEVKYHDLKSNPVHYEMPFYNIPSLRKLIMKGEIDPKIALNALQKISDFMFTEVYTRRRKKAFDNYAKIIHLNRIKNRLKESMEKSKILSKIILASSLIINGKRIPNIFLMLKKVENNPKLLTLLQPKYLSMVHGDLHFDNMLIDLSKNHKLRNFILIDPRGLDYTYDLSYDLGKLWHSFYGLYDFFHEEMFDLNLNVKNGTVKADFSVHKCPALREFHIIESSFESLIKNQPLLREDPHWKLKTLFSNVSHFCSMMPFHLKGNETEKVAIAIYLRGMELFSEFLEIWSKSKEWEKEVVSDAWININSLEDYLNAKTVVK